MSHYVLDSLFAPFWLATNLLLGLAVWRLGRVLFPGDGPCERIVHCLVMGWGCIVSSATVLGLLGELGGPSLLALVASASVLLLVVARRTRIPKDVLDQETFPPGAPPPLASWDIWTMLWLYMGCYWLIHVAFNGLGGFPRDWDSLHYHIPMIDHWLHARSLYAPSGDNWSTPGNNELLGLWMVAPFSGDFLIGLNNLPSVALLASSALGVGVQLGLSRATRNLAALVVVSNSVVMNQLVDQKNDVAVGALFIGTLFYGLRYARDRGINDAIMAAVSLGLLSGIKYFALGYAALACAALLGLALFLIGARDAGRMAFLSVGGILIWGGYWYARNYFVGGSPFYPLMAPDSGEAGRLPKVHANIWVTSLYGHRSFEVLSLYSEKVLEWMGPLSLLVLAGLPASLAWLIARGIGLWCTAEERTQGVIRIVFGFLVVTSGLVLAVTPVSVGVLPDDIDGLKMGYTVNRYGLGFVSLAVLAFALSMQDLASFQRPEGSRAGSTSTDQGSSDLSVRLGKKVPWFDFLKYFISIIIIITCFYTNTYYRSYLKFPDFAFETIQGLSLNISLFATTLWILRQGKSLAGPCILPSCLIVGILALSTVGWLSWRWHDGFPGYYDELLKTETFSTLSRMDPSLVRIATFCERPYPFFGSARQFDVTQPLPMQRLPTYSWLLRTVVERHIDIIAARASFRAKKIRFNDLHKWLLENPRLFSPILKVGDIVLYRVDRPALEERASVQAPIRPD